MSSNSLFSKNTILNIKKIHKGFLWVAVGILIASLILGAVLIFVDTKNEMFGKVQGTFAVLALAAFICVNNLIRIEKGNKAIQTFALTGFFANLVWLVMGILMIWGVMSPVQIKYSTVKMDNTTTSNYDYYDKYDSKVSVLTEEIDTDETIELDDYDYDYDDYDYDYDYDYEDYENYYNDLEPRYGGYNNSTTEPSSYMASSIDITVAGKILAVVVCIASIGFWVSNILAIKDTISAVKALKIIAIACQVFSSVFIMVLVVAWPFNADSNLLKWAELAGLTSSGFILMALAAWVISRTHKDFAVANVKGGPERIETMEVVEEVESVAPVTTQENEMKDEVEVEVPADTQDSEVKNESETMSDEGVDIQTPTDYYE